MLGQTDAKMFALRVPVSDSELFGFDFSVSKVSIV